MALKTLVVSYLPNGTKSNTRRLLETFLAHARNAKIETLDLTQDVPDFFLPDSLAAYYERNYGGQALAQKQTVLMQKFDRYTAQFKAADVVVLAYPMFNFSLPAAVKAYFDAVMLKGETWELGPEGFRGLMKGKRALILSTSGAAYEGEWALYEHSVSLAKVEFGFMGFDPVEAVTAAGINLQPEKKDEILASAQAQIRKIAAEWYAN